MALIQCNFNSLALKSSTTVYVVLPDSEPGEEALNPKAGRKYQTLYLLHGINDDCSKWVRRTPIERYAKQYHLAVVMPDANMSFYTDMVYGNKYWTYISEELPRVARSYFPLSDRREDNFVAGASMGGYGSFKLAFLKPENFCAAASFSGALDAAYLFNHKYTNPKLNFQELAYPIFGGADKITGTKYDLFYLAKKLKDSGKKIPELFQYCGTEDGLYKDNLNFKKYLDKIGIDSTFSDGPGGHTWEYWDTCIQQALQSFPLSGKPAEY